MALKPVKGKIESQELNNNFSYLESMFLKIDKGSPKGVFSTLTDLENKHPNGADGIFVVSENGHWYFWDGVKWSRGGIYQSVGIADDAITMPNFNNSLTTYSENLFNGVYSDGLLFGGTNSLLYARSNYDEYLGKTAVIPIGPNRVYTVTILEPEKQTHLRIGTANKYIPFQSGAAAHNALDTTVFVSNDNSVQTHTFKSGNKSSWLYVYVSNNGQEPELEIKSTVLKLNAIEDVNGMGALFTYDKPVDIDFKNNKLILHPGTALYTRGLYRPIIPFNATEPLTVDLLNTNDVNLIYIDADHSSIKQISYKDNNLIPSSHKLIGYYQRRTSKAYINGNYTINGKSSIEDGSISFNKLDDELQEKINNRGSVTVSKELFFYEDLVGEYNTPKNIEGVQTGTEIDIATRESNFLWEKYDELMGDNPSYITKRRIGYGSASDGSEDTNLPIYEYAFKPALPDIEALIRTPIMLVQSGIHGDEKAASWATYLFFKDLCENHTTNNILKFLYRNIEFRVVPIANPHSYNVNKRMNARGIDPNRNFSSDFISGSGVYYGGAKPMTEQETLTLDRWYQDFNKKDVIGMIDMHNFWSLPNDNIGWYASSDPGVRTLMVSIAKALHDDWMRNIPQMSEYKKETSSMILENLAGTARNHIYKKYGIRSVTLDPLRSNFPVNGIAQNDSSCLYVSLSGLGSTIVGFVKNFSAN